VLNAEKHATSGKFGTEHVASAKCGKICNQCQERENMQQVPNPMIGLWQAWVNIGAITSRCPGKEPATGSTRESGGNRAWGKHVKLSNVRGKLACGFNQWSALFCSQIGLFAQLTIQRCPGLVRLVQDDETIEELLRLPPEAILLRWFNYHLQEAGHVRRVSNFSTDISDAQNYSVLLHQVKRLRPPHFLSADFLSAEKKSSLFG